MGKLGDLLVAAALWAATIGCAYAGFWLSEIVMSEEAMRRLGPVMATVAGVLFFFLPFATIALGALACWRTVPAKKR